MRKWFENCIYDYNYKIIISNYTSGCLNPMISFYNLWYLCFKKTFMMTFNCFKMKIIYRTWKQGGKLAQWFYRRRFLNFGYFVIISSVVLEKKMKMWKVYDNNNDNDDDDERQRTKFDQKSSHWLRWAKKDKYLFVMFRVLRLTRKFYTYMETSIVQCTCYRTPS